MPVPPHPFPWSYPTPSPTQLLPSASSPPDDSWFMKHAHLDSQILTQALQRELSVRKHGLADTVNPFLSSSHTSTTTTRLPNCANPSNAGSPMSTSDRLSRPGSPFNSCANSPTSMLASNDSNPTGVPTVETQIAAPPVKPENAGCASAIMNSWPRSGIDRLSAQASVGAGATKVSKKRSKASTKAPIRVLSADTTNFRAMVQKLTGMPGSPIAIRNRYHFWNAPSAASILKPQPSQSIHGLPTLDTSAFLLLDGASSLNQNTRLLDGDSLLQRFTGLSSVLQTSPLEGHRLVHDPDIGHTSTSLPSAIPSLESDPFNSQGAVSMPKLWDLVEGSSSSRELNDSRMGGGMGEALLNQNDSKEVSAQRVSGIKIDLEQLHMRQAAALESFLMGNDKVDLDLSATALHSTVDSWLSPKMELAHTA